jgi:hypothetical protein
MLERIVGVELRHLVSDRLCAALTLSLVSPWCLSLIIHLGDLLTPRCILPLQAELLYLAQNLYQA